MGEKTVNLGEPWLKKNVGRKFSLLYKVADNRRNKLKLGMLGMRGERGSNALACYVCVCVVFFISS